MNQSEKDRKIYEIYSSMSDEDQTKALNEMSDSEVNGTLEAIKRYKESNKESVSDIMMEGPRAVAKFGMSALDYTAAPVRSMMMEAVKKQKEGAGVASTMNPLSYIGEAIPPLFLGPSSAPTGEDIAKEAGVPEEYQAGVGFLADIVSGVAGPELAKLGMTLGEKSLAKIGKFIDQEDAAARALGVSKKDLRAMIKARRTSELSPEGKMLVPDNEQYANDIKEYLRNYQDYSQNLKNYREGIGQAASDSSQPVLPGQINDLQRTELKQVPVELQGSAPSKLAEAPIEYSKQDALPSLPLPDQPGPFNQLPREDLIPLQQELFLNDRSKQMIQNQSSQGNIIGDNIIPRSQTTAEIPGVGGPSGQTEMMIEPQAPVVPKRQLKEVTVGGGGGVNKTKEAIQYARENGILSGNPFKGGVKKTLERIQSRASVVGKKIGELRRRNASLINKYINDYATPQELAQYHDGGFNYESSKSRIFDDIDNVLHDSDQKTKIKAFIDRKLKALTTEYGGGNLTIDKLASLKADWQKQVSDFSKSKSLLPVNKAGYDFLQREARRAMDNEFEFIGKALGTSEKSTHSKLLKEYSHLMTLEDGVVGMAADQLKTGGIAHTFDIYRPIRTSGSSQRFNSMISQMPLPETGPGFPKIDKVVQYLKGPVKRGAQLAQVPLRGYQFHNQETQDLGGFDPSKTAQVQPGTEMIYDHEIKKSDLPNLEKALRRVLLHKHGRVVTGP